jgi:hypothetical protein
LRLLGHHPTLRRVLKKKRKEKKRKEKKAGPRVEFISFDSEERKTLFSMRGRSDVAEEI